MCFPCTCTPSISTCPTPALQICAHTSPFKACNRAAATATVSFCFLCRASHKALFLGLLLSLLWLARAFASFCQLWHSLSNHLHSLSFVKKFHRETDTFFGLHVVYRPLIVRFLFIIFHHGVSSYQAEDTSAPIMRQVPPLVKQTPNPRPRESKMKWEKAMGKGRQVVFFFQVPVWFPLGIRSLFF